MHRRNSTRSISHDPSYKSAGATLIEILITLVIIAIGFLGTVGLQIKLQQSEFESYQRSQALLLLKDMTSRLTSNRYNAAAYATAAPVTAPLGAGANCPVSSPALSQTDRDIAEWCALLQGAAELTSAGDRVGALLGARGCVQQLGGSTSDYVITVTWQGATPAAAANNTNITSTALCGGGTTFDVANSTACTGNRCRRSVSATVKIATL